MNILTIPDVGEFPVVDQQPELPEPEGDEEQEDQEEAP